MWTPRRFAKNLYRCGSGFLKSQRDTKITPDLRDPLPSPPLIVAKTHSDDEVNNTISPLVLYFLTTLNLSTTNQTLRDITSLHGVNFYYIA